MATPNIIPNANNQGRVGKSGAQWLEVRAQQIFVNGNAVATSNNPTLTGTVTIPTAASESNAAIAASTAWVRTLFGSSATYYGGVPAAGELLLYYGTGIASSGHTPAYYLDLANQTGTLDSNNVAASGEIIGSNTIAEDIAALIVITDNLDTAVQGAASGSHEHVGSDITDADSDVGAASTIVKRNTNGGVFGKTSTTSTWAIKGEATGTSAIGVYGTTTNSTGHAGYFGASGIAASGSAIFAYVVSGSGPAGVLVQAGSGNYLELRNTTSTADILFAVNYSLDIEWKKVGGTNNTKKINRGVATASRVATLPDATGTLVLGDGSGITDAAAFRTAIGLGSSGVNPAFATVAVTSSSSDGYRFSSGAKLALQSDASTSLYLLPSDASATMTLVDGAGVGITNAAAFRAAIGAASAATTVDGAGVGITNAAAFRAAIGVTSASAPSFTGAVTINPASGSNMLVLVGALGFSTTVTCNSTAARSLAYPDVNGILLATTSGLIAAVDISDSTTVGRSLVTAASATAGRVAIDAENASSVGWFKCKIVTGATIDTSSGDYETVNVTSSTSSQAGFSNSSASLSTTRDTTGYSGTQNKFLVIATVTIESATNDHDIGLAIIVGGTVVAETIATYATGHKLSMTISEICTLADNDLVKVAVKDHHGSPHDLVINYGNMTITAL